MLTGAPSRYNILKLLGKGSWGETYLAEDLFYNRRIGAFKWMPLAGKSAEVITLAKNEFQILAKLSHPNIAKVYDFGVADEGAFLFTEFVDARDMIESLKGVDYNLILFLFVQILRGLDALHSQKILHRDLKPANILLVRDVFLNEPGSVKIIDFGISVLFKEASKPKEAVGSLAYMAPELFTGKEYDQRADLYSAGVIFYKVLTGRFPIGETATKVSQMVKAKQDGSFDPVSRGNPNIPVVLCRLTDKLLARNPEDRFASAVEALDFLNRESGESFGLTTADILIERLRHGPCLGADRTILSLKEHLKTSDVLLIGEKGGGKSRLLGALYQALELDLTETYLTIGSPAITDYPFPAGSTVLVDSAEQLPSSFFEKLPSKNRWVLVFDTGSVPGSLNRFPSMTLEPWTASEAVAFIDSRFGLTIDKATADFLMAETHGNPGSLVEFIELLVEERILQEKEGGGGWSLNLETLQKSPFDKLVTRKTGRLTQEKRTVLKLCSFASWPLTLDTLARTLGIAREKVQGLLSELEREGLILRELKDGVAAYRARLQKVEEILLPSLDSQSVQFLLNELESVYKKGDLPEALFICRKILHQIDRIEKEEDRFHLLDLGSFIFLEAGEMREAERSAALAERLPINTPERVATLSLMRARIAFQKGEYETAQIAIEDSFRSLDDAENRPEPTLITDASNFKARLYQRLGRIDEARYYYQKAMEELGERNDPNRRVSLLMNRAALEQESGRWGEALSYYQQAVTHSEGLKKPRLLCKLEYNLGNVYLYLGRLEEAA